MPPDHVSIHQLFPGQEQFITDNPVQSIAFQVITLLLQVIGAVTLVVFILGGILLLVSQGDENRIQAGKNMVKFGIIGLIIAMTSYLIAISIQSILLS